MCEFYNEFVNNITDTDGLLSIFGIKTAYESKQRDYYP
jgi:hypothetical protein